MNSHSNNSSGQDHQMSTMPVIHQIIQNNDHHNSISLSSSDYPILRGPRPRTDSNMSMYNSSSTTKISTITSNTSMSDSKPLPTISVSGQGQSMQQQFHQSHELTNQQLAQSARSTSILPQLGNFLTLASSSTSGGTGSTDMLGNATSNLLDTSLLAQKNDILKESARLTSMLQNRNGNNGFNTSSNSLFSNGMNQLGSPSNSNNNFNINPSSPTPQITTPTSGYFNTSFSNSSIHNPLNFNVALLSNLTSTSHSTNSNLISLGNTSNAQNALETLDRNNNRAVPSLSAQPFKLSSLSPQMEMGNPMGHILHGPTSGSSANMGNRSNSNNPNNSNMGGRRNSHNQGSSANENSAADIMSGLSELGPSHHNSGEDSSQWFLGSLFDRRTSHARNNDSRNNGIQEQNNGSSDMGHESRENDGSGAGAEVDEVEREHEDGLGNTMTNEAHDMDEMEDEELSHEEKIPHEQIYQPPPIYPVLKPIIKEINYIPSILTAEFMEVYFSNTIYSVAPILRRYSMLCYDSPRKCSPALLYSILYVSAHASNHPIMTSGSQYKPMLIAKLLESTMAYLQPMRDDLSHSRDVDLDDVIAYINIGIVENASDFEPSSMKWWSMAVTLARSLKLNKEIPAIPEEAREERRRTWWSLFMVDRHLSLCFNRPCMILDSECLEIFFPISKDLWDSGTVIPPGNQNNQNKNDRQHQNQNQGQSHMQFPERLAPPEEDRNRRRGLQCTVVEAGLFGMYLPLMTLLGGILELHFFELSPMFSNRDGAVIQTLRDSYRHRLKAFQYSLEEYYAVTDPNDTYYAAWGEYCECVLQVLYILLEGYWDPTDMLDDIDVLLNDSRFDSCLHNSIAASRHVDKILRLDPDLQLVPFFFGIQLLLAGFIPFCMSERYGSHTSTDVAQACELFVRAHEVSLATLSTQYQVNFRSLLHGVIRDMKHTTVSVNDRIVSTNRRRVLMSMYRWNPGGTGLAV